MWAGQPAPSAHYTPRDGISGGPGDSLEKAMRCNARVAFCFGIIYDCLTVKIRTLFVLREQSAVSGFAGTIWETPWMGRVLRVVAEIAAR